LGDEKFKDWFEGRNERLWCHGMREFLSQTLDLTTWC
jgi:hypothetical protein